MRKQPGDTIIEVVVAITVFSLVAVGSITVMNNGLMMAQRSLEITLVRQQIDAQAEMLRYIHDRSRESETSPYRGLWTSITPTAAPRQLMSYSECPEGRLSSESIALTPREGGGIAIVDQYVTPVTYARVVSGQSQGISIQLARVSGGSVYDAYIQACWYAPGLSRPMTLGTIVRLYDPEA